MTTPSEFEVCVVANRPKWVNWAQRYMPRQDAEDVVSEAITEGWRKLHQFKGNCSLLTWLGTILRNEIYTHHRRPWNTREHVPLPEDDGIMPGIPEVATQRILFGQICRAIDAELESGLISAREHEAIMGLYTRDMPNSGAVRLARFRGIRTVRVGLKIQIGILKSGDNKQDISDIPLGV